MKKNKQQRLVNRGVSLSDQLIFLLFNPKYLLRKSQVTGFVKK